MKDFIRIIIKFLISEKILKLFTINKTYGNGLTKLIPNHYQYKKNTIRTFSRNGISLKVDLSDIVGWFTYYGYKEISKDKFIDLIKNDDIIFDVGANIGAFTLAFAKKLNNSGAIYSFEPFEPTFNNLKENLSLNCFKNIKAFNFGFGDVENNYNFDVVDQKNQGMNRIMKNGKFSIEVKTIDNFVLKNDISSINLMKIDVEGFEYKVLLGAKETLIKHMPILFIELDDNNLRENADSAKNLICFLENLNYKIYNAETFLPINSSNNFTNCHLDILCKIA